jgi:O-antigen/teichoic acid export membrane protein
LSQLIVSALIATGMMIFLFRNMGTKFSWPKFREMARYGYPVAFASIGNFFLVFSDRYFLNHFVGMGAVGVYAIAYRFAFILSAFVFNPFQQIWGPQRFAIAKLSNARDIYRRVFLYVNVPLAIGALGIALFARDVLKVMATHAFVDAYRVVPLILIAQILHHWTSFNNLGLFLTKTTTKFAWGSAVAVPAVLILNVLLIPWLGVWGAALATIGAYVVRFLVIHKLSQDNYHIDYDWPRITRLYAIVFTAYGVRAIQRNLEIVSSVLIGGTLMVVAVFAVWKFVLHADERKGLIDIVHRRWPVSWRRATLPTEESPIEALKVPVES